LRILDLCKGRLKRNYGLEVIMVPEPEARNFVNSVIYDELSLGKIISASRHAYPKIIDGLVQKRAEEIILGCTEIGFLVQQADARVPLFDTAKIHATAAVEYALEE
jgi:aspartate racemase